MRTRTTIAIGLFCLSLSASANAGAVLFVDDDAAPGGDGLSWNTAFTNPQAALSIAAEPGSDINEIRIAGGVYKPDGSYGEVPGSGDPTVSFDLVEGLTLKGAYAGVGAPDPDERDLDLYPTRLSGMLIKNEAIQSHHVLTASDVNAVLDGMIITDGFAPESIPLDEQCGGGAFISGGALTAIDCTFDANQAHRGGSLYALDAEVTLTRCVVSNSESSKDGAGAYLEGCDILIAECLFTDNFASAPSPTYGGSIRMTGGGAVISDTTFANSNARHGGAINLVAVNPSFVACRFVGNTGGDGGAVYSEQSQPQFLDCMFQLGRTGRGAGLFADLSTLTVTRCAFTHDHSDGYDPVDLGSAVYLETSNADFSECVFDDLWAVAGPAAFLTGVSESQFADCVFTNNRAAVEGGAVLALELTTSEFIRCRFESNRAEGNTGRGGALFARGTATCTDCMFIDNFAWGGGAVATTETPVHFRRCEFVANEGDNGACVLAQSDCEFVDCLLLNNTGLSSGAIHGWDGVEVVLQNTTVAGNTGGYFGGGLRLQVGNQGSSAVIANSRFLGNNAMLVGGAIFVPVGCSIDMVNTTIAGNTAPLAGGVASSTDPLGGSGGGPTNISNCILWNNTDDSGLTEQAQLFAEIPSNITLDYSCVEGLTNLFGGVGNIGDDPMFVDGDGPDDVWGTFDDDVRLRAGSPCIDAADNTVVPADTLDLDGDGDTKEPLPIDFAGLARFIDDPDTIDTGVGDPPIIDMGAHEFPADSCLADLDGDDSVGPADLAIILGNWGPVPPSDPVADLTGDGVVGPADLAIVLGNWGPCP